MWQTAKEKLSYGAFDGKQEEADDTGERERERWGEEGGRGQ